MGAKKPATKSTAAARKAVEDQTSTAVAPLSVEFCGQTIDLITDRLPNTFTFDMIDLIEGDLGAIRRIVVSLVGEDGFAQARSALAALDPPSADGGQTELQTLIEDLTAGLGSSLEKSSASDKS